MPTPTTHNDPAVGLDAPGAHAPLATERGARSEKTLVGPPRPLSSVGAKGVMAVTGILLTGFVIGHLLGNMQVFLGRDALNGYAQALANAPALVWGTRSVLLAAILVHIALGTWLALKNRAARPVPYVFQNTRQASLASRTMMWTGLVILAFLLYHLAHFTFGWTHPEHFALHDDQGRHDVYGMVIAGFRVWWVTASYVVAQLFLGLHLWHGGSSFFQSLGISHPRCNRVLFRVGPVLAVVVAGGNIVMPLAVFARLIG